MRIVFCPAEIKEIIEIFTPSAKHFLLFLPFLRDIIISCGKFLLSRSHRLFHERVFLSHGKNGNLCSALREILSALSDISSTSEAAKPMTVEHYYLMRIVFLLSRRNEGNKGNSLTRPMRSPFCHFCSFFDERSGKADDCGTLLSHAHSIYIVPQT